MAEIDHRAMPDPEGTKDDFAPSKAEEATSKNAVDTSEISRLNAELKLKDEKIANISSQKDHWREKYDRDINKPKPVEEEFLSDEELTKREIEHVKAETYALKESLETEKVTAKYPQLKGKLDEFKEFKKDYPGASMDKVAKFFLVENDLLDPPKREGLERPSAGGNRNPSEGIGIDDAKRLREQSPRKYVEMLRKGQIDPDKIR